MFPASEKVRAFVFSLHLFHLPHALDFPFPASIIQDYAGVTAPELVNAAHFMLKYT